MCMYAYNFDLQPCDTGNDVKEIEGQKYEVN